MRRFLSILFICYTAVFAQSGKENQSIELPDFVITGVQNVRLPFIEKNPPKLISILSREFFTPQFSTETFAPSDISTPKKLEIVLIEEKSKSNGKLQVGAGLYTLPQGRLDLDWNFNGGLIDAGIWGVKETDYIDFAGNNSSGGSFGAKFFVNNGSRFLSGAVINAQVGFEQNTFNFFASPTPDRKRRVKLFHGDFSLEREYLTTFNFGINFLPEYLEISEDNFSQMKLHLNSFLKLHFNGFGIYGTVNFENNSFDLAGAINSVTYISGNGYLYAQPGNSISLKGGVFYSSFVNDFFLKPFASATLKFSNNFSISTELNPRTEFYSSSSLLKLNRLFGFNVESHLTDINIDVTSAFKYEFLTYFELHGGLEYMSADNYLFFEDTKLNGEFAAFGQNGATKIRGFANALFNPGPMGYFYGSVQYQSVSGAADWQLPYHPKLSAELKYGTKFEFGLDLDVGYKMKAGMYADLKNLKKLPDYHNAFLELTFSFSRKLSLNFEVENLLNNSNYLLYEYQEKPFDAIGSIVYKW